MMLEAAMAFEHIIKNPKAGSKGANQVSLVTMFATFQFIFITVLCLGGCSNHMGQPSRAGGVHSKAAVSC